MFHGVGMPMLSVHGSLALMLLGCGGQVHDGASSAAAGAAGSPSAPLPTGEYDNGVVVTSGGSHGGAPTFGSADASKTDVAPPPCTAISLEDPIQIVSAAPTRLVLGTLFVMLDRSGTMVSSADASTDKWIHVTLALDEFMRDPASEVMPIGLGTFPAATTTDAGVEQCGACGSPVVPFAPLPGNADAVTAALEAERPAPSQTMRPTECALRGLIQGCQDYRKSTDAPCAAVLITDGAPNACDTSTESLLDIVASGAEQGIPTYAIGLQGADRALLDKVAEAGTTGTSRDGSPGKSAILDELGAIRTEQTPRVTFGGPLRIEPLLCSYAVPSQDDPSFDESAVNVEYSTGGAPLTRLGRVPDKASCFTHSPGWFYDDAVSASLGERVITICENICPAGADHRSLEVRFSFGCRTEWASPL